jgi:hypothetical protein
MPQSVEENHVTADEYDYSQRQRRCSTLSFYDVGLERRRVAMDSTLFSYLLLRGQAIPVPLGPKRRH